MVQVILMMLCYVNRETCHGSKCQFYIRGNEQRVNARCQYIEATESKSPSSHKAISLIIHVSEHLRVLFRPCVRSLGLRCLNRSGCCRSTPNANNPLYQTANGTYDNLCCVIMKDNTGTGRNCVPCVSCVFSMQRCNASTATNKHNKQLGQRYAP